MMMQEPLLSRRDFLWTAAVFCAGTFSLPPVAQAAADGAPGAGPAAWSELSWEAARPVLEKILVHPFIRGLADGSLPRDRFLYFIRQDGLYLESYAKTLAVIASRLPRQEQRDLMTGFIADTIAGERALHELYRTEGPQGQPVQPSPTCQLYMSFEARLASTAPVEVAAAVILPCFRVYQHTGRHLLATCVRENNPYAAWIDSYGDEHFDRSAARAVALCDELAAATTPEVRERMTEAYVAATRMEWMFWDSAWKKEAWPV